MENLENLAVEEVIEEVVVEPTKPSVGSKLAKGAIVAAAAFGVYKGVKWVVGKVRKAKKAAEEVVEDAEE